MHPITLFDAALAQHRRQTAERDRAFVTARRRRERTAAVLRSTRTGARGLTRDDVALAR